MIFKLVTRVATSSILICLAFVSFEAPAALINIEATSNDSRLTDFTLKFDDISGDGLLQINEILAFSGFALDNPGNPSISGFYNVIIGTPDIAGVSSSSGTPLFALTNWNFKRYIGDTALCCASKFWTYNSVELPMVSATITTIPVPAALWLFFSGLIGLAGASRYRS